MKTKVKWGIIAPGWIAEKFATGIAASGNGELYGVCSRKLKNAKSFMDKFGGVKAYDSEEAIANDPDVDIVYVANPHPYHLESALTCLNASKPVLCEKPMTVNAADTKRLVDAARKNDTFLMEAMWTRFLPTICKVREILASGRIGEVRMMSVNFGFKLEEYDPASRLLSPDLAGGALLDVGIYPLALCSMVLGKPSRVQSSGHLGSTGVDEQFIALFEYGNGVMATASGAIQTQMNQEAMIYGSKGSIRIAAPWWAGSSIGITGFEPDRDNNAAINNAQEEIINLPYESNGYNCEAEAVAEMILAGKKESEIMPLDESLELAQTMDIAREQWGLKYPFE